jgi:hypothetical protein
MNVGPLDQACITNVDILPLPQPRDGPQLLVNRTSQQSRVMNVCNLRVIPPQIPLEQDALYATCSPSKEVDWNQCNYDDLEYHFLAERLMCAHWRE